MNLGLDNIKSAGEILDTENIERFFTDEDGNVPSREHMDQIVMLKGKSSEFLWNFEHRLLGYEVTSKFFRTISTFDTRGKKPHDIKKYLHNLNIPYSTEVFIADHPTLGFVLNWKMIIKYSSCLFDDDQQVWDKTFNWKLEYHHDGVLSFGRDLVYNQTKENSQLEKIVTEMKMRTY